MIFIHVISALLMHIYLYTTYTTCTVCIIHIRYNDVYGGPHNDAMSSYLVHCLEKFETLDLQTITDVLTSFMQK